MPTSLESCLTASTAAFLYFFSAFHAHCLGDITVFFARRGSVIFHDGGKEDCVGHAVRGIVDGAQRVRHGVHDAKPYVRETHARDILTERHPLSALFGVGDRAAEGFGNQANRFQMEHIRHLPGAFGDIAFNRVRQRVHTRGSRQALGHRSHHFGIDHSNDGNVVYVHADEFALLFDIRNDIINRDLGRRARRRGNRDDGNGRILRRRYAFQRTHVLEFGIGDDDARRRWR